MNYTELLKTASMAVYNDIVNIKTSLAGAILVESIDSYSFVRGGKKVMEVDDLTTAYLNNATSYNGVSLEATKHFVNMDNVEVSMIVASVCMESIN